MKNFIVPLTSKRADPALASLSKVALGLLLVWSVGCSRDEEPKPETTAASPEAIAEPSAAETAQPETEATAAAAADEEDAEDEAAGETQEGASDSKPATQADGESKKAEGDSQKSADKPEKTPDTPKADKPKEEAQYSGPNPCKKTKFAFGSVKTACQTGGQGAAKELMKTYTKRGKDKGLKWKCSTCHSSTKTYENKPNAVSELKKIF